MTHLPVLVVLVPLVAALLIPVLALGSARAARIFALAALLLTQAMADLALHRVLVAGTWHYRLGGWAPPWGIEYVLDPLSGGMAVLVSFMALLTAIYAGPHLAGATRIRSGTFHALFLLLAAGLLGIVVTGDVFNLYVFLEISSLAGYALLASGTPRAAVATFRYLLVGTVAATFYLLGIGFFYAATGTLNMADLGARLAGGADPTLVGMGVALVTVGLAVKSAVYPLHGWLPDAYSHAPASVIPFVAAVMSKVGAYALFRMLYFVVGTAGAGGEALRLLGLAAAVAVVAGSAMALAQRDVRRMLAYSSVGQMGYVIMGFAIGNAAGVTGALLHILNHAVMKGCLFMSGGAVAWRTRVTSVREYAGMARRLPLTMAGFSLAALSMIGLPPTCGFFSKWYLVLGALQRGAWPFVVALVASSLMTAAYFLRLLERAYFGEAEAPPAGERRTPELPLSLLAPVLVLALGTLALGIFNQSIVTAVIRHALPGGL